MPRPCATGSRTSTRTWGGPRRLPAPSGSASGASTSARPGTALRSTSPRSTKSSAGWARTSRSGARASPLQAFLRGRGCYLPRRSAGSIPGKVVPSSSESLQHLASSAFGAHIRGGDMPTGTVKWFSNDKGYGFITPDDGSSDVFVHHSSIEGEGFKTLDEGAKVEYETEDGPKGPAASGVKPTA